MVIFCFLFTGIFVAVHANNSSDVNITYDNYQLVRLHPHNEETLAAVRVFQDPEDQVEVLKRSYGINDSLDALVPPARRDFVQKYAKDNNLKLEVKHEDYLREALDVPELQPRRRNYGFDFFQYHSYDDIVKYLSSLNGNRRVTVEEVGRSYEGRPLILVKISNPNQYRANNPIIFVDAGIHAREWAAPAMALYLINKLAFDQNASDMLDGVDWYILPVVNPDGYEFSRSNPGNRLWRKTRSESRGGCKGADGNRNYGFKWATSGVSSDPCNRETFPGSKPFSEPETRAVRDIILRNKDRIKLYVSLHAYGQYLVYPWGYTGDFLPDSWPKLDQLAKRASAAVVRAGGSNFKVMSAGNWYPAAGGSDDFAFAVGGVPYSYTMEITDGYEFTYPANKLFKVLPSTFEGFRSFSSDIKWEFRPS